MSEQVGEGYIEVEYRVDNNRFQRFFRRQGTDAGSRFGMNFGSTIRRASDRDLNLISRNLAKMGNTGGRGFARTFLGHFRKLTQVIHKDVDVHSRRLGRNFGNNFVRGVDAAISLLPGRMEALFSGRGGPIGLALGASLIAGVASTLPALGAMVSGAMFAGFGSGVVAAGIALVAKDPRVVKAAQELKKTYIDRIWDSKGAEMYARQVTAALGEVNKALIRWAPLVDKVLQSTAHWVGYIAQGAILFVDGFIEPFSKLMRSPFMSQIMATVAVGFARVGVALGKFFEGWLSDPAAQKGALMGLITIFDITAKLIIKTGEWLRALSRVWYSWNKDPDGAGPAISKLEKFHDLTTAVGRDFGKIGSTVKDALVITGRTIFDVFKDSDLAPKLERLWRVIVDKVVPALGDLVERNLPKLRDMLNILSPIISPILDALTEFGEWFADPKNRSEIDKTVTVLLAAVLAFKAYNLAIRAAAVGNSLFATSLAGAGLAKGNKGAAVKGGALGGALGGILGGSGQDQFFQGAGGALGGMFFGPIGGILGALAGKIPSMLMDWWRGVLDKFFPGSKAATDKMWSELLNGRFSAAFATFRANFFQQWGRVRGWLVSLGQGISEVAKSMWNGVVNGFTSAWNGVAGFFASVGRNISSAWSNLWANIANTVINTWNNVRAFLGNLWIVQFFIAIGKIIVELWVRSWNAILAGTKVIVGAIVAYIRLGIGGMATFIANTITAVRNVWNVIWNSIASTVGRLWAAMWAVISGALRRISQFMSEHLGFISRGWNVAWSGISSFFGRTWQAMYTTGKGAFENIRKFMDTTGKSISVGWSNLWSGLANFFGTIWFNITTAAGRGINGLINIINGGINKINDILGKLGISARIPLIGGVAYGGISSDLRNALSQNVPRLNRARGGPIHGPGTETSDSIPVNLSKNEYVIRAASAKKLGYGALDFMNRFGAVPMASGGQVYQAMMAWAQKNLAGVRFSSTYRPGDPGYHGRGQAVDMIFSDGSERRGNGLAREAFNKIKSRFFTGIAELIWDFAGSKAVWNGKEHFFTGSGAGPGTHNDHIHWAMAALKGGGGGGLLGTLLKPWKEVLAKMVGPAINGLTSKLPNNGLGLVMKGAGGFFGKQLASWIKGKYEELQAQMEFSAVPGGDIKGSGKGVIRWSGVVSQALKMLGLPSNWLGPMLTLISRESGGNPNAINRWDSNAARGDPSRGLAQVIGSTFRANHVAGTSWNIYDPLANVAAALNYIRRRYGSIFNVQQANASMPPHGYDSGGILPPGFTAAYNGTGSNEYVYTAAQNRAIMEGGRGDVNVKVYVDGVEVASRAVVEENNREILNAIRRGKKGGR